MTDLVERVVDAMLRARVSGGGVEHEAHVAIRLALEEAAKVADEFESDADPDAGPALAAAIRAMIPTGNDPEPDDTGNAE